MRFTLFPGALCVPDLSGYTLIFLRFSTVPCSLSSTHRPDNVLWRVEWGWCFLWDPKSGASGFWHLQEMLFHVLKGAADASSYQPQRMLCSCCSAGKWGDHARILPHCVAQELPSAGTKSKLSFSKFSSA